MPPRDFASGRNPCGGNNDWKFVYTGCLDRPLSPVISSRYAPQIRLRLRSCLFLRCWPECFETKFFRHFVQDWKILKPGASSQTRGRMIRTKWRRERKKIKIELTYYQSFSKDSGPHRRKGQYVINRLCTRAWALVCWICGALRLRFRRHEWHQWSIQTTGKSNL